MGSANLRFPRPFRQKQIPGSAPQGPGLGKTDKKLRTENQFHKSQSFFLHSDAVLAFPSVRQCGMTPGVMRTPRMLAAISFSAIMLVSSSSPAQSLTPAEKTQVSQMIEELHQKLHGSSATNNSRAVSTLQAILKSPKATSQYYMACIKELQFDAVGKRESEWREWRERNEDRVKSTEHVAALQYQAKFLLLTLAVALEEDEAAGVKKVMPLLIDYYDDLTRDFDKLEGHRQILITPALESVFADRLKLTLTMPSLKKWIDAPLPVSAVYDEVILPHFRKEKNHSALQAAWDKRIVHESKTLMVAGRGETLGLPVELPAGIPENIARRFGLDSRDSKREQQREDVRQKKISEEDFRKDRLPILHWGKNRDALLHGSNAAASLRDLGRIIRENLAHSEAPNWLKELKSLAAEGSNPESDNPTASKP